MGVDTEFRLLAKKKTKQRETGSGHGHKICKPATPQLAALLRGQRIRIVWLGTPIPKRH